MRWKEFFKQNLMRSLIFTLVLLVISTLITFIIPLGIETYGIPFPEAGETNSGYFPPKIYRGVGSPVMFYAYDPGEWPGNAHFPPLYNYYNFIIDVIIWYLISCLIIFIYNKLKKPKKKKKK